MKSPPYGLTAYAVQPVVVIPGHRFDPNLIPKRGMDGERRSIATFKSVSDTEIVVRSTWPRASAAWIEWTFVLEGEVWAQKGTPSASGSPADDAQEWDAYRAAKQLMARSGYAVRS